MKNLSGGIDIGSEQHHIIIMNDEEKILVVGDAYGFAIESADNAYAIRNGLVLKF